MFVHERSDGIPASVRGRRPVRFGGGGYAFAGRLLFILTVGSVPGSAHLLSSPKR